MELNYAKIKQTELTLAKKFCRPIKYAQKTFKNNYLIKFIDYFKEN